ncbi:FadR/GntR family transcriptional regulator [uncultured Propionivibrio sp.]|uniref:FadR/GntR family transcriptional regulator n=1 Tax=uncultured Propionivibrio sp. TaxID=426737 RepID=UPI0029C03AD0|nr:FadR/GntR family transcriptional regulator [uncultured Propionivibrio sp.]
MNSAPLFNVEPIAVTGTLTDRVCEALTQLIASEDFGAGARLPSEQQMAGRFGVSRTVIREAVSRLKSEGLVESRQGSGVFVRERNIDTPFRLDPALMDCRQSVLQVIELRQALEGEIAALAATRRTPAQMTAIRNALSGIAAAEAAGDDGVDADIAFHRSIAAATGNPHFLALTEFLFTFLTHATRITRGHEATKRTLSAQVKDEHQHIVDAIAAKDIEAARAAARQHMECAMQRLGSANLRKFRQPPA